MEILLRCFSHLLYKYFFRKLFQKGDTIKSTVMFLNLDKKTRECCSRADGRVRVITAPTGMLDPHPVSYLEVQHCQVGSCFVRSPRTIIRQCLDLWCTVQHNVCINVLTTITMDIDKEDIHPRQGSSEYPVTRVVAVAHVGDDKVEYQGTAFPGSTARFHTGCECYPFRHIYKND